MPPPPAPPADGDRAPADPIRSSPWVTIWTRPRATIRAIVDDGAGRGVFLIAGLVGFAEILAEAMRGKATEELSLGARFGLAAVVGPIGGVLWLYLVGGLVRLTGGWIGGVATPEEARAAIAWGAVPRLVSLGLIVAALLAYGPGFLRMPEGPAVAPRLLVVVSAALMLNAWGVVLTVRCLAEVHRFSSWEGLAAGLIAALIFGASMLAVAVILLAAGAGPVPG